MPFHGLPPWNKGLTKETDERVRMHVENPERIRKISESLIGNQHRLGTKHSLETRLKMRESHKGEKSYLWKGGIHPINRKLRASCYFRDWRKAVFERDNFTCLLCGDRCKKGRNKTIYLHPHHLLPFAKYKNYRFEEDNGTTLCKECHEIVHLLGNTFNPLFTPKFNL